MRKSLLLVLLAVLLTGCSPYETGNTVVDIETETAAEENPVSVNYTYESEESEESTEAYSWDETDNSAMDYANLERTMKEIKELTDDTGSVSEN